MVRLYADEQFPRVVSELLRTMEHDVLTVQEAGNANLGIPDEEVLAFAIDDERAVVTLNRQDFIRLHRVLQPSVEFLVLGEKTNTRTKTYTNCSTMALQYRCQVFDVFCSVDRKG